MPQTSPLKKKDEHNRMQCHILQGAIDVGAVDMGFHYPNYLVGLP